MMKISALFVFLFATALSYGEQSVTIPSPPTGLTVERYNSTGNFTVSWDKDFSESCLEYELYLFGEEPETILIPRCDITSYNFSSKPAGEYTLVISGIHNAAPNRDLPGRCPRTESIMSSPVPLTIGQPAIDLSPEIYDIYIGNFNPGFRSDIYFHPKSRFTVPHYRNGVLQPAVPALILDNRFISPSSNGLGFPSEIARFSDSFVSNNGKRLVQNVDYFSGDFDFDSDLDLFFISGSVCGDVRDLFLLQGSSRPSSGLHISTDTLTP